MNNLGLVSFLSCLYLGFTILLLFKKKTMGNVYILFGSLTFLFVIGYSSIPLIPKVIQNLSVFIIFSLMILLLGIMCGTFLKSINKSNKACRLWAIIMPLLLILVIFNIRGYLTYMYIPVLMYMIQDKLNNYIDSLNK